MLYVNCEEWIGCDCEEWIGIVKNGLASLLANTTDLCSV